MNAHIFAGVIVALIVVVIIISVVLYQRREKAKPGGGGGSFIYEAQPAAQVWDKTGGYMCKGSSSQNWCILDSAKTAEAVCNADPQCIGYLKPADQNYSWWGAPPGSVQLVSAPPGPDPNPERGGTIFYKKTTPAN
jgi:hypothetical protein